MQALASLVCLLGLSLLIWSSRETSSNASAPLSALLSGPPPGTVFYVGLSCTGRTVSEFEAKALVLKGVNMVGQLANGSCWQVWRVINRTYECLLPPDKPDQLCQPVQVDETWECVCEGIYA